MDWFSRFVLARQLSVPLDGDFCLRALDQALQSGKPQIFNSDQGVHFTSQALVGQLLSSGIAASMDGRGRALDNVLVERLWRTVNYEEVYLKDYANVQEATTGFDAYFRFYNQSQLHPALGYRIPNTVHFGG